MKGLKKYYFYKKGTLICIIILTLLSAFFTMSISLILYLMIEITTAENFVLLIYVGIGSFLYIAILSYLQYVLSYSIHKYVNLISEALRKDVFYTILSTDNETLNKHTSAEFLTLLRNDVSVIAESAFEQSFYVLYNLLMIIFGFAYAFFFNYVVALIMITLSILIIALPELLTKKIRKENYKVTETMKELSKYIDNSLNGTNIIKNCEAIHNVVKKIKERDSKYLKQNNKYSFVFNINIAAVKFLAYILEFLTVFVACVLIFYDMSSIAIAVGLLSVSTLIYSPVSEIITELSYVRSVKDIVLKITSFKIDKNIINETIIKNPSICLQNLKIGFDNNVLLNNVSYTFEFGKKYLLTGESGIGKSSLLNVMMGLNKQIEGSVYFTGDVSINKEEANTNTLIGYVRQKPFLFIGNLKENITLFSDNVDEKKLSKIIKLCKLEDFVKKRGLETPLDNNTNAISLGEMQRICLARILYLDRPILFLDEITSSLDSQNTNDIYDVVKHIKNKLIIWISHEEEAKQLNWIDKKIKIEKGKVYEFALNSL